MRCECLSYIVQSKKTHRLARQLASKYTMEMEWNLIRKQEEDQEGADSLYAVPQGSDNLIQSYYETYKYTVCTYVVGSIYIQVNYYILPLFQIINHSKNLEESKFFKFDQDYREKYKDL